MRGAHYTLTSGPMFTQPINLRIGATVPAFFAPVPAKSVPPDRGQVIAEPPASDPGSVPPAPQHTPPVRNGSRAAASGCATRQQMVMRFSMILKVVVVKKLVGQWAPCRGERRVGLSENRFF